MKHQTIKKYKTIQHITLSALAAMALGFNGCETPSEEIAAKEN